MTTRLERYRDHCRAMATAEHRPECPWSNPEKAERENKPRPVWRLSDDGHGLVWGGMTAPVHEPCDGCITDAERVMWAAMADEAEAVRERLVTS